MLNFGTAGKTAKRFIVDDKLILKRNSDSILFISRNKCFGLFFTIN